MKQPPAPRPEAAAAADGSDRDCQTEMERHPCMTSLLHGRHAALVSKLPVWLGASLAYCPRELDN